MKKNGRAVQIVGTLVLAVMSIFLGLMSAAMATLAVLAITDVFFTGTLSGPDARLGKMIARVNWTYATVIFATAFAVSQVFIHRKDLRKLRRDARTSLSLKTSVGSAPAVRAATPPSGEPECSFKIRRITNRYGDTLIGLASVRFKVPGVEHEFRIEQRQKNPDLDLLSVVPVFARNSAAQLIGKYDMTSSDQGFLNAFMADDGLIGDLLNNYNGRQRTTVSLKTGQFFIECEEEDIFDNGTGVGHEDTLLNVLKARASLYYDRFRTMGLIAGPPAPG